MGTLTTLLYGVLCPFNRPKDKQTKKLPTVNSYHPTDTSTHWSNSHFQISLKG